MSDLLFLTVCTVRQLPQALALGQSVDRLHPNATFLIGLADAEQGIAGINLPYQVLPVSSMIEPGMLNTLSGQYSPTELAGALKPTFIRAAYTQFPEVQHLIYLDPNSAIYAPLTPVLERLQTASVLLTPFMQKAPADDALPDEKYMQNIGLYNADFLAFRRSAETDRMLPWWEDRVQTRARIDFCESLCLDQIWLMHVPAFFDGVQIAKNIDWHRGLWNWHEWGGTADKPEQPLWVNFKGLYNRNEGFFAYQTRVDPTRDSALQRLLTDYRAGVQRLAQPAFDRPPAYGRQPEKPVVFGWRRGAVEALRSLVNQINTMPLPVWK
ncbi:hypothetical protein F5984_13355 [Rudanella paleaurantiibacter]|uniref:Glycosyl transferase n=1 Tax=Rudanella paleaurantiibacter TaxID=2614655 RepID=A0A7J5TYF3_9BACT|nr:hypothetical protein [Rudanella paleaurantiibacter]KAB7730162.1 hypothetical protein F5984_13355 [Rudanella paleaurantiibacter]